MAYIDLKQNKKNVQNLGMGAAVLFRLHFSTNHGSAWFLWNVVGAPET